MKNVALGLLAAGAVSACLLFMGAASGDPMDRTQKVSHAPSTLSELNGVWRSQGYGRYITVSRGRVKTFEVSGKLCVQTDLGLTKRGVKKTARLSADRQTLRLPIDDPAYLITFDKVASLPDTCSNEPGDDPEDVLESMIDVFSQHYAFFNERGVSWAQLANESREQLGEDADDEELLQVMANIVAAVGDAHVSLETQGDGGVYELGAGPAKSLLKVAARADRPGVDAAELQERLEDIYWEHNVAEAILKDDGVVAGRGNIAYGLIGDDIGYIAVRSLEGFTRHADDALKEAAALEEALDDAMELFEGARAVIVDVTMNEGGFDTVARTLAGRFAEKRTVGYYKYAGDAEDQEPQAIYIEPSENTRFTGPVYLLTSDVTMSAAEILTLSMRALPNVTHVGEKTRGSLSDILTKPLPNGWLVNLSNEVYLDVNGERWEGFGIPPQVELDVFSKVDLPSGHVKAVEDLVGKIRSKG